MDRAEGPTGYKLAKALMRRPLFSAYDVAVEGAGNVPAGPVIIAANHRSFMDSVFLGLVVDRPIAFLAKAEYFDRRRTAWMFRSMGQIPIRRGSPAGARLALDTAGDVLSGGGVVGIYPEGTRSRDGQLHRGHLGPARLARASGAPVVPVGLVGTESVQAPGHKLPRLGKRIEVRFGAARRAEPGDAYSGRALRDFTDLLMADIGRLCGQTCLESFAMAGV